MATDLISVPLRLLAPYNDAREDRGVLHQNYGWAVRYFAQMVEGDPIPMDGLARLVSATQTGTPLPPPTVGIDDRGQVRLIEGRRRTSLAAASGKHAIPCRVIWRHPDWMTLREHILAEYPEGGLYNSIDHPDFTDIPTRRASEWRWNHIYGWCLRRTPNASAAWCGWQTPGVYWRITDPEGPKAAVVFQRLRVLDIGCHFGFFANRWAGLGATVTGLELNDDYRRTATRLRQAQGTTWTLEATRVEERADLTCDIALYLSVAHHHSSAEADEVLRLLDAGGCKAVFFDGPPDREPPACPSDKWQFDELGIEPEYGYRLGVFWRAPHPWPR
jgi:SAM-dependent methyltransferase